MTLEAVRRAAAFCSSHRAYLMRTLGDRSKQLAALSSRIEAAAAEGRSLDLTDDELRLILNPAAGDVRAT